MIVKTQCEVSRPCNNNANKNCEVCFRQVCQDHILRNDKADFEWCRICEMEKQQNEKEVERVLGEMLKKST